MKSRISARGQVTIPKGVRTKLRLGPGTVIEFRVDRGRFIGTKVRDRDVVDELYGALTMDEAVDGYLAARDDARSTADH